MILFFELFLDEILQEINTLSKCMQYSSTNVNSTNILLDRTMKTLVETREKYLQKLTKHFKSFSHGNGKFV